MQTTITIIEPTQKGITISFTIKSSNLSITFTINSNKRPIQPISKNTNNKNITKNKHKVKRSHALSPMVLNFFVKIT